MTTISPGYRGEDVAVADAPGINAQPDGQFTYRIKDIIISASSEEELQEILNFLALKNNKPVEELKVRDITLTLDYDYFNYKRNLGEDGITHTFTLTTEGQGLVQNYNDTAFFGDEIPFFPSGSATYLNSGFNTEATGSAMSAQLGGLMGAAQYIYNANYSAESDQLGPIQDSDLDPNTLTLLENMFGPNTEFNQGHLNTLKMMGLLQGDASQAPSTWTPNENGTTVVEAFANNTLALIPSMGLLTMTQTLMNTASEVPGYFTATGYAPNYGSGQVEKDAKAILEGMAEVPDETLPPGLAPDEETRKMLNFLFGLPADNTNFTTNQLNTAISMGLVSYNPVENTIAMTTNGGIYLADKNAAAEATNNKDPNTNPRIKELNDLIWALNIMDANWATFDQGAGKGGLDNVVSVEDLEGIIRRYGADSDQGKAAQIILNARNSGNIDSLFRGNVNKTDSKFSRGDFDQFRAGLNDIKTNLLTTNEAAGQDGYPPLNTTRTEQVLNALKFLKSNWGEFESAKNGDQDNKLSRDDLEAIRNSSSSTPAMKETAEVLLRELDSGGNEWLNELLFIGDGKNSGGDLDALIKLMEHYIPKSTN
jgi:hypothetical protein